MGSLTDGMYDLGTRVIILPSANRWYIPLVGHVKGQHVERKVWGEILRFYTVQVVTPNASIIEMTLFDYELYSPTEDWIRGAVWV